MKNERLPHLPKVTQLPTGRHRYQNKALISVPMVFSRLDRPQKKKIKKFSETNKRLIILTKTDYFMKEKTFLIQRQKEKNVSRNPRNSSGLLLSVCEYACNTAVLVFLISLCICANFLQLSLNQPVGTTVASFHLHSHNLQKV